MKRIAVFPGSFDPITLGHCDIINRALPLFDKIIVAIGQNSGKNYMFSLEKRKQFLEETFKDYPNIEIDTYEGLTVDYCLRKRLILFFVGSEILPILNLRKPLHTPIEL